VKWYDDERGFGFLANDEGGDVYVNASALPNGTTRLRKGQRVEFGVAAGRRGDQALSVRVLDPLPSLQAKNRTPAEEMAPIIEDLIKLLDGLSNSYRRGRLPDPKHGEKVAAVLRAVADDIEG
jgi:CspA family cold shock protein